MTAVQLVLSALLLAFGCLVSIIVLWIVFCRIKFRKTTPKSSRPKVVAFFHPYCSAGGGGERVLWKAVQVLGDLNEQGLPLNVVIYTIDEPRASYREGV